MSIMTFDPSLTHFCYSVFDVQSNLIAHSVIKTKPDTKKGGVYQFDDKKRRLQYILGHLIEAIDIHEPEILVTERFDGCAKGAKASMALSEVRCLIFMLSYIKSLPLYSSTIQEVKEALTGDKKASKVKMMKAAVELYPELRRFINHKLKDGFDTDFEHIADSIGVFEAFKKQEMYKFYLNTTRV